MAKANLAAAMQTSVRKAIQTVSPTGNAMVPEGRTKVEKVIIISKQSVGDIVMLTAGIRDLKASVPALQIDVHTPFPELWQNNPNLTILPKDDPSIPVVEAHYPLIQQSNQQPWHFIHGYRKFFEELFHIPIPQGAFRGDIHLSLEEQNSQEIFKKFGIDAPGYGIIISGGKSDFTTKIFDHTKLQEVVDRTKGKIRWVQIGGKSSKFDENAHLHKDLTGVINTVGQTTIREMIQLIYWSNLVLTPISAAMHLAEAIKAYPEATFVHRPTVVLAGGRESPTWEAYPHHRFLHSVGTLKCCFDGGCWRNRVTDLGDGKDDPKMNCFLPILKEHGQTVPKCLDDISVDMILNEIGSYYRSGVHTDGNQIAVLKYDDNSFSL